MSPVFVSIENNHENPKTTMIEHSKALLDGMVEASKRTKAGSLNVDITKVHCEGDEEVTRLKRKLQQKNMYNQENITENIENEEPNPSTALMREALLSWNNESFLKVYNAKRSRVQDNIPVPIAATSEKSACLSNMLSMLEKLTRISFITVDRTIYRNDPECNIVWHIRGSSKLPKFKSNVDFSFVATFEEQDASLRNLKLRVPAAVQREIPELVYYCEKNSCFRTFCMCFAQYCELFAEREILFHKMIEKFPGRCTVSAGKRDELHSIPGLAIKRHEKPVLELYWTSFVSFQKSQMSHGTYIQPRLELYRIVDSKYVKDETFDKLVLIKGLDAAVEIIVRGASV